jgi:hypothetical protein
VTDRYIAPGLWNYAVRPGGTVRFYASSRGAKADGTMPSTGELWLWLKNAGFDGTELRLWPLSAGRPVDWPSEDPDKLPPPMEPDAIIFRGEGRWAKSDLPTAIEMQLGPRIQFWMVWQHEERGSARVSGDGRNGPLRFGVFLSLLFGAGIAVSRTAHKQLKR